MPRVSFDSMPGRARLWIFAAERDLAPHERDGVFGVVDRFLDSWSAHGHPLTSARDLRHGRFLLVAVDDDAAGASGCSIDALVREIRALESRLSLALLDHGPVLYREGATIRRVARDEFADLARDGRVTRETPVFDNTIGKVEALDRWEVPAGQAWHGRAFF
jgi:hypothetical protein